MAREIKTTPVIKGKDAQNFYHKLEANKNKKVDRTVMQRIEQSVLFFKSSTQKTSI
jgi:hypothetical protein